MGYEINKRPHGQEVKTPPFHGGIGSSILPGDAKKNSRLKPAIFFGEKGESREEIGDKPGTIGTTVDYHSNPPFGHLSTLSYLNDFSCTSVFEVVS